MVQLAGSVWGGGPGKLGYAQSWNGTENALKLMGPQFHNRLLILDEATAAGKSKQQRAENIFNVVHRISLGRTKSRMDGTVSLPFDTIALSSSNDSLSSYIAESAQASAAADVRLFSIPLPDRETGFFESVPADFESISDALGHIRLVSNQHYGVLSEAFIRRTLKAANSDWEGFLRYLKARFNQFLEKAWADQKSELEMRRAKPFALAYAAGCMAKNFGLLKNGRVGKFPPTAC